MKRKILPLTAFLVATLVTLMLLLIGWAQQSIELRQSLFIDQLNKSLGEKIKQYESTYYCFEFEANSYFTEPNSFGLINPFRKKNDTVDLSEIQIQHKSSDGEKRMYDKIPVYSAGRINMKILMEFEMIPEVKHDSELTGAEKFIRNYYKNCLVDSNGKRLADPIILDSLINQSIIEINPEAEYVYTLAKQGEAQPFFESATTNQQIANLDFVLYTHDEKVDNLVLSVFIPNLEKLFSNQSWNVYLSSGILIFIALLLIGYLVWMQIQQRKMIIAQQNFVHSMTHEFNTPLTSIKLIAQKLLNSPEEPFFKSGKILKEEGNRLQTGINLVLTTALIEKDELLLQKEDIDINAILLKLADRNEELFRLKNIELELMLTEKSVLFFGDEFHLENVFQNVLNNALKHSDGSMVIIRTLRSEKEIILQIADDGKGIPKQNRSTIFQKFGGRTSKSGKNGFGLGLFYSKTIIDMHKGSIVLLSPEKGTEFEIRLKT